MPALTALRAVAESARRAWVAVHVSVYGAMRSWQSATCTGTTRSLGPTRKPNPYFQTSGGGAGCLIVFLVSTSSCVNRHGPRHYFTFLITIVTCQQNARHRVQSSEFIRAYTRQTDQDSPTSNLLVSCENARRVCRIPSYYYLKYQFTTARLTAQTLRRS